MRLLFVLSIALLVSPAGYAQIVIEEETDEVNVTLDTSTQSGKSNLKAIALSALVPGAGETYLHARQRATWHFLAEAALWSGFFVCLSGERQAYDDARTFAYAHAGAKTGVPGKGNDYYQNVADYFDVWEYNGVAMLNRENDKLYREDEDWAWAWDSRDSFDKYKGMLQHRRSLKIIGSFMLGGMAVHRFLSMIDTGRLAKRYRLTEESRVGIRWSPQHFQVSFRF